MPAQTSNRNPHTRLADLLTAGHAIGLLIDGDMPQDTARPAGHSATGQTAHIVIQRSRFSQKGKWDLLPILRDALSGIQFIFPATHSTEGTAKLEAAGPARNKPQKGKIKNYVIIKPYGPLGSKLFLHGKDIFTPEAAERFYADDDAFLNRALLNPAAVERVRQIFLPESFEDRVENYFLLKTPDVASSLLLGLEIAKERYPNVDFSSVPAPTADNGVEFLAAIEDVLKSNGIDMTAIMEAAQAGTSPTKDIAKKRIREEMPGVLEAYLRGGEESLSAQYAKRKVGTGLRDYMAAHQWDWEILDNFKAAVRSEHAETCNSLEELLLAGAGLRAERSLTAAAMGMHNPYDSRFDLCESEVARHVVNSVQPELVLSALRDHTALMFVDDREIAAFGDFRGFPFPPGAYGKYQPNSPLSRYFSNFLLFAGKGLGIGGLTLCHEFEHKLDLDAKVTFSSRYGGTIPQMIAADFAHSARLEAYLATVADRSSAGETTPLFILARKKGMRFHPALTVEEIRDSLLHDIRYIRREAAVFAPEQAQGEPASHAKVYATESSQWVEIPAILEELKATYGKPFIDEVLPQLSQATEQHRRQAIASLGNGRANAAWRESVAASRGTSDPHQVGL
jgi:hypothetical protein